MARACPRATASRSRPRSRPSSPVRLRHGCGRPFQRLVALGEHAPQPRPLLEQTLQLFPAFVPPRPGLGGAASQLVGLLGELHPPLGRAPRRGLVVGQPPAQAADLAL